MDSDADLPNNAVLIQAPNAQGSAPLNELEVQALALNAEGYALCEQDHYSDAAAVFLKVVEQFGTRTEPYLREAVAYALYMRAAISDIERHRIDALGAYGALLGNFSGGESAAIDRLLVRACERYTQLKRYRLA